MMRTIGRHIFSVLMLAAMAMSLATCKDDLVVPGDAADPDLTGEAVMFTTNAAAATGQLSRADVYNGLLGSGYKTLEEDYKLKITMYEKDGSTDKPLKSCTYAPASTAADNDGTLTIAAEPGETALYWDSSTTQYAFGVTAGSDNVVCDQSDKDKWLLQDRLSGVAYAPLKGEGEAGTDTDQIDALNYRTSREWYQANKIWMPEQGIVPASDFKKIPLFLRHDRAWITVILKAGEGVDRKYLDFATADERIAAETYCYDSDGNPFSYDGSTKTENGIKPWMQSCEVDYEADVNGPDETRSGVRYDAIVEPYDYLAKAEDSKICKINVSGQNFSFYASNDKNYNGYKSGDPAATTAMQAYNLTAGKHLVITAVLSRESRKILITAYVEDWTEMVTSNVCDDFGMNGDPITIQNRQQLIDFLSDDSKNKPGNVAIVSATSIDLDKLRIGESETDDPWSNYGPFDLKCTLNLGGCVMHTSEKFLNDIATSGGIINGVIDVKPGSTVESAVCSSNEGSIEYIAVRADGTSHATKAGFATINYGSISKCTSALSVVGEDGTDFAGGIAAKSIYKTSDHTIMPIIDNCIVTGKVCVATEATATYCGGIAGLASGRVSNNTFEYGMSLLQSECTGADGHPLMLNIVNQQRTDDGATLSAYGNQWPIGHPNDIGDHAEHNKNVRDAALLYDEIIDCQAELEILVKENSEYNAAGKRYRIGDSFAVSSSGSEPWPLGFEKSSTDNSVHGNVLFLLEGNGKTITLTGDKKIDNYGAKSDCGTPVYTAPMLFNNIMGTVQNLIVYCDKPLYGVPNYTESGVNAYTDGCAPFAYSIYGGKVSGVTVYGASGAFVQAATVGGIVVSLHDGGIMENCDSFMDVRMYLPTAEGADVGDAARYYAGGVAAIAEAGTVTQCRFVGKLQSTYNSTSSPKKTPNLFMGGIVGGLRRTWADPKLTITDCSSWWTVNLPASGATRGAYTRGSLIGRARYSINVGTETHDYNGMSGCEGNYWRGNVGAGSYVTASEAAAIGVINSVTPEQPTAPNE